MIKLIVFIISVIIFIGIAIYFLIKNIRSFFKEKSGLKNESMLYKSLVEKFTCSEQKNGYLEKYHGDYEEIIASANDKEIEHAVAIISSSLEVVNVEGIIITLFSIVIDLLIDVYVEIAKSVATGLPKGTVEMCVYLGGAIVVMLMWGGFWSRFTSVNRQKFFLELMQLELNRREKGEGKKMGQVENENIPLDNEYQQLEEQSSKMLRVRRKTEAEEIEIEVPVDKDTDSAKLLKQIRKILD